MTLDIIPGIGIGAIRGGMSPHEVERALSGETRRYQEWMGGNLSGSLFYRGLLFDFDACTSHAPLPKSHLETIVVHGREDATLFGKPLADWTKDSITRRLREEGHAIEEFPNGDVGVKGKFELSFGPGGELTSVEIYFS